jgi:mannose/fructose/N-acetylgalactosamine-specific phosphotransferase system component IIC
MDFETPLLMTETSRVLLAGFGAGLAFLETWPAGQFLLTRPVFLFPLLGFLLGLPAEGLWLGLLLELLASRQLPMGASLPPDPVSAGLIALLSSWLATGIPGFESLPRLLATLLIALFLLWPLSFLTESQRRLNARIWLPHAKKAADQMNEKCLARLVPVALFQTWLLVGITFSLLLLPMKMWVVWIAERLTIWLPLQMEQAPLAPWTGGFANLPFVLLAVALGGVAKLFGSGVSTNRRNNFRLGLVIGAFAVVGFFFLAGKFDG